MRWKCAATSFYTAYYGDFSCCSTTTADASPPPPSTNCARSSAAFLLPLPITVLESIALLLLSLAVIDHTTNRTKRSSWRSIHEQPLKLQVLRRRRNQVGISRNIIPNKVVGVRLLYCRKDAYDPRDTRIHLSISYSLATYWPFCLADPGEGRKENSSSPPALHFSSIGFSTP